MEEKKSNGMSRRDTIKALATLPVLGYFGYAYNANLLKIEEAKAQNYLERLKIDKIEVSEEKLSPPTGNSGNRIRFGVVGNGWRGEQLLKSLGYVHPDYVEDSSENGIPDKGMQKFLDQEDLNVEFAAVCDTFEVHTRRGVEISANDLRPFGKKRDPKPAKVFSSYKEMIASDDIDAIIIATADHTHAQIAIEAAKAGKHIYLEKPMTHSIEEAVELRKVIKDTGVVFQLGHQNRQQMSFKIANELYEKGVFGDVSMVQVYTNRNTVFGAWIRDDAFDHKLGNKDNINWEEFLGNVPLCEFDRKKYFSWQRYSEFGTSITGNDLSHQFECMNQVLKLGIPETVVALGGQYYYKHHGDMPDVFNAVFNYPERGLTMTYDGNLKNDAYRPSRILGSAGTVDVDRAILMYKDNHTDRYKDIILDPSDPFYYYAPDDDVDAISSATSQVYMKGGYGPTTIDGKTVEATLLHLKEWVDAIRGQGKPSCDIEAGFEEAVTFNLANLAYEHKKVVTWDKVNEKAIIG
ncbi:Gfo/Idh/MocA family protein [Maribacter polysiphoniae]|uniref:Gfo/Idh/MocA family protein n=1 Tax=Maribacter polysiphoniae TaxID=429344 RepID=UPI0023564936|nr:Gfo/Idh/MocA family oxidoreductase [Maribacter polysiphoniae]